MNEHTHITESHRKPALGLTSAVAQERLLSFGPNRVATKREESLLEELLESLREPLVLLLLAVGALYFVFGELRDALIILGVIVTVAITEASIEWRAGRAVAALSAMAEPNALVWRDGILRECASEELVPEDLIELRAGSRVPADARLVEADELATDDSLVTGESEPVPRDPEDPAHSELIGGTTVVRGRARAVVIRTGTASTLGQIAELVAQAKEPKTPLQRRMGELARALLWVAIGASVVIPSLGILFGRPPKEMLLTGLSLAFATIPEELPVLIVVVLGLGSLQLARRGAIIRRLIAAETMGSVTIVCTDKTGTLTENRMTLDSAIPAGALAGSNIETVAIDTRRLIRAASLASENEAIDPVDRAIWVAAGAAGIQDTGDRHFLFDRTRRLASGYRANGTSVDAGVKGAPESVLARCSTWRDNDTLHPLDEALRSEFVDAAAARGKGGRALAVASRSLDQTPENRDALEADLVFEGLIVLRDPLRASAPEAVATLTSAGVGISIVTGDQLSTAEAVAAAAGIRLAHRLTGPDLDEIDDATLAKRMAEGAIVARALPADKLRIVRALDQAGAVVMVTGDGVNDAPALRAAAVGVAMGRVGSDVARQAAQVVLTDDSFATLVAAMREGRRLYDNFRKAIQYYLAVKIALILATAAAAVLGLPLPFTPVQIVVLELFMDLGAALAFVGQPAEPDVMRRPPRNPQARFFDRGMLTGIFAGGITLALLAFLAFRIGLDRFSLAEARTLALVAWMVGHAALGFVMAGGLRRLLATVRNPALIGWIGAALLFAAGLVGLPAFAAALGAASVHADAALVTALISAIIPLWLAALGPLRAVPGDARAAAGLPIGRPPP